MGFAVLAADRRFRARLRMQFAVSRREFAVSRREATVPIVLTNGPRSLSHRIDDSNRDYLWTSQFSPWRNSMIFRLAGFQELHRNFSTTSRLAVFFTTSRTSQHNFGCWEITQKKPDDFPTRWFPFFRDFRDRRSAAVADVTARCAANMTFPETSESGTQRLTRQHVPSSATHAPKFFVAPKM